MAELVNTIFRAEFLTNRLNQLQARIRPVLEKIDRGEARNHDAAVANLRNQIVARARFLDDELSRSEPQRVRFDSRGYARLTEWSPIRLKDKEGKTTLAIVDAAVEPDGRKTLHIATGPDGRCVDAWRTRVIVSPGRYRFEARVRTAGVELLFEDIKDGQVLKGEGAGIRISRAKQTRPNKVLGDAPWQTLHYDFEVTQQPFEVELICELRAAAGEAWFDADSLRLKKN
jgi:hypothetical protein